MNKEEMKAFAKEIASEAIVRSRKDSNKILKDALADVDRKSVVSLAESKESTNRMLNTALAKMNRDSAESLLATQEVFLVVMTDKMDQMHRDAMIMVEQIRDDNMIFGEAISGLSDKFDKMSDRLDIMDERFDRIDIKFEKVDDRLNGLTIEVKEIKEILIKNIDKRIHVLEVSGQPIVVHTE